ncbi:hypothetical protein ABH926_000133 [Catenulispora sp. GP43]|uniref:hypothetical protein n=1 Tax=Catenulispora sp. GP43 TaxID=3156263 RepID=UPI0035199BB7
MTDWVTISSLATAGTTVILAAATLKSVRSASRAAAAAERAVLVGLRPVLLSSRLTDRDEKIFWADDHWAVVSGGRGYAEIVDGNIYFAISIRNAGAGLAVLQGWAVSDERKGPEDRHTAPQDYRRMIRDLFVPAHDVGYWHAAIRQTDDPQYDTMAAAIKERRVFTVEVLYSDHEGGQSSICRFVLRPREKDGNLADWIVGVGRHWNLDRPDPRDREYA